MYINKWGRSPFCGTDKIHPDGLTNFIKNYNSYKVFQCTNENSSFITIRYNTDFYRVKGEMFIILPKPRYVWGDTVVLKNRQCIAIVAEIMWHVDKKEYYYFVTVNGRKKSKRYFENELCICERDTTM